MDVAQRCISFRGGVVASLLVSWAALAVPAAAQGEDAVVVLLKPSDCGLCPLLEEALRRRGSVRDVTLDDGRGTVLVARLERRSGADAKLASGESAELAALPSHDAARWARESSDGEPQAVLKRDGRIVAAGGINRSLNLRELRYPRQLTDPPEGTDPQATRNAYAAFYREVYLKEWSLDFLLRQATLGRSGLAVDSQAMADGVLRTPPVPAPGVASRNVLLAATASGPVDNEVFNAERILGVRQRLQQDIGVGPTQFRIFHGGDLPGGNAVEDIGGRLQFVQRDIPGAVPFRLSSLASVFEAVRVLGQPSRNLLVLIGHGSTEGAGMWGEPAGLSPTDLAALHRRSGADNVLVSGNCFGGVMAKAVSCGFFGARPDVVATGCQASAAQVAASEDYIQVFFGALRPERRRDVDTDKDGQVSFEEAHWEATLRGDPRNITYTTLDSLADEWFASLGDAAPHELTLGELREIAAAVGGSEEVALRGLTGGLTAGHRVPVQDLAAQGREWSRTLSGPRPALGQLARRLLYLQSGRAQTDPTAMAVRQCGARPIGAFLSP